MDSSQETGKASLSEVLCYDVSNFQIYWTDEMEHCHLESTMNNFQIVWKQPVKYRHQVFEYVSESCFICKCSTSYLIVYDTSQYYYFDISRRHWCKMTRSLGSPFFWRLFSDLILPVRFNTINHFVHKHTFLPLLINSPTKLCVSFCLHSEFRWTSWKISLCIQE